jgi:hypothetical protein
MTRLSARALEFRRFALGLGPGSHRRGGTLGRRIRSGGAGGLTPGRRHIFVTIVGEALNFSEERGECR